MATYATPGVYVQEISTLPPSVADVATAIPAFIGYTQLGPAVSASPTVKRVATMLEFETAFGGPQLMHFNITEPADAAGPLKVDRVEPTSAFCLYYALSHYFKNGGGPCYVVSVGDYTSTPSKAQFSAGLDALKKEDEPTLIVLTDAAVLLDATNYYSLCSDALTQCNDLGDRFTILDVQGGDWGKFRTGGPSANLMYGAAYHPYLQTSIAYKYVDQDVNISGASAGGGNVSGAKTVGDNGISISFSGPSGSAPRFSATYGTKTGTVSFSVSDGELTLTNINSKIGTAIVTAWEAWKQTNQTQAAGFDIKAVGDGSGVVATEAISATDIPVASVPGSSTSVALNSIKGTKTALYNKAKTALDSQYIVLPPSAAMAGIYARVDREQGVWKAPANVGVLGVLGPVTKITNEEQGRLNIDATAGKSINAIRDFTGKGTLVWGSRTLAGNDNEWRYVSVRRLFINIEESTKKASAFAVFEPNDQSTWLKVKAMIESYLYGLWEQGALAGSKPEAAYYVHVGLGTTMTPQDVLEGRMIVEIGIAAVRPAEFIVLRFSHKMQTA